MKKLNKKIWLGFIGGICSLLWSFPEILAEVPPQTKINLDYRVLQPGEIIKLTVKSNSSIMKAQFNFGGKKYPLGEGRKDSEYFAFMGLDLAQKPGTYTIFVSILYEEGTHQTINKEILVSKKEFPVENLWVEPEYVTPPPEILERIKRESQLLNTVYEVYTSQWWGKGNFIVPCSGKINYNFGKRRIFNNIPRSPHGGVDISSPAGTPVRASNSGEVVLANDLYFAGKTVIINHGLGVFTVYCHFSKMEVESEEWVEKGTIIGEVGSTGRVTGSHLHWGVKVRGKRVDPFSLVSLDLD